MIFQRVATSSRRRLIAVMLCVQFAAWGTARADNAGPTIDVWYGSQQTFGIPGIAQHWVNVLGNVADPDGIRTLVFSLNGGAPKTLSIGPDQRRLLHAGDFNIEIDIVELQAGDNDIEIAATDTTGRTTTSSVTLNYAAGNIWPLPYAPSFASVPDLQTAAQVIDGAWSIEPDGLRSPTMGYDRVIGFGDLAWTDYDVTATITLLDLDPAGFLWPSVSPGFGITLRWSGHTDDPVVCSQPHCGWLPSGGGFWYDAGHDGPLALWGDLGFYQSQQRTLSYGVPYTFRIRAEDQPGQGTLYALKVWEAASTEPVDWEFTGLEPPSDEPSGSLIIIAHHVDILISALSVTPVGGTGVPTISNVQVATAGDSATVSWHTNEVTTGAVAYGATAAYEDGSVASATAGTSHTVVLGDLVNGQTYHFQITAVDLDGEDAHTADDTFVLEAVDIDPPLLSDIQANAGQYSAVITWATDEPATSVVDYGISNAYGDSSASASLVVNHQITLSGLAPETTYHFRVTSADAQQNAASSGDLTFTTTAAPLGVLVSDEFNGAALDTGVWTFVNPLGDASVSMTGTQVSIDIPVTADNHEIWIDGNNAPRIVQAAPDTDFEFAVKFDSPLTEDLQIQGIAIEQDANNVVRAEFHYLGGATRIFVASIFGGSSTTHRFLAINLSPPMYMKARRTGDAYSISRSSDGENYVVVANFDQPMTVSAVGIHAGASAGVAHSAVADFFLDLTDPPAITDCNANGIDDADEIAGGASADCNGNGVPDECEPDCDASGVPDDCEALVDCNANGTPDACEVFDDCNATGIPDECELAEADCDGNGVPDECQPDSDGDGAIDACDGCPDNPDKTAPDGCGCGQTDIDSDGDGVLDCVDNCPNIANTDQADCDADGVGDACGAPDCNENGVPDDCDIANGDSPDADGDGVPDECNVGSGGRFEAGVVAVNGVPVTVSLANTYTNPVVVCTMNYDQSSQPTVVRVSNATATNFDVRLQNPSGNSVATEWVSYLVMEEGGWTIDGIRCEAQAYTSTVTSENNRWRGERQNYLQSYAHPVVIGQVMSENDPRWSVFWCQGRRRSLAPSATQLSTGKTVCEDGNVERADETIGFIVFERGHDTIGGVAFEAAVGSDSVKGIGNSPPYSYPFLEPFASPLEVGLATMAGVDNGNGGWAYTFGDPATAAQLALAIDEDQIGDSERRHTTEQVGYVVFESPVVYP